MTIKIAMWSGPRNISTALMRSFGNRSDTVVTDEPFYASYLAATGLAHPLRDRILASQPTEPQRVVRYLLGPIPAVATAQSTQQAATVWYQKQMAHHVLPSSEIDWLAAEDFAHVFLLREPEAMLRSLRRVLGEVTIEQTGLPQQVRLFDFVWATRGTKPSVVHAETILNNPAQELERLCNDINIPFEAQQMLRWPAGPRSTDGVWGPHWYANVYKSTGFAAPKSDHELLPKRYAPLLDECMRLHARLSED